jgi:hypothetical protein
MKTCYFGESLRTSLRHYIQQKSEALHLYNGQEAVLLAGARMDKR